MNTPLERIMARVEIAEKEIELGCELLCKDRNYYKGNDLTEEELKHKKYGLKGLKLELNRLEDKFLEDTPLPF